MSFTRTAALLALFFFLYRPALYGQKDKSIELGWSGFIPETLKKKHTASANNFTLNQGAFWRDDNDPAFYQGMFADFFINKNKKTLGWGFEYSYDYHEVFADNYNQLNLSNYMSFRVVNYGIYSKALLHLKHNYKVSGFIGLKAGVIFHQTGFSERVLHSKITNMTENDAGEEVPETYNSGKVKTKDAHKNIDWQRFTPGVYAALLAGMKIPFVFLNPLLKKADKIRMGFGIRITLSITAGTPSLYNKIKNFYGPPAYTRTARVKIRYLGMRAGLSVYTRFRKKKEIE
ncbi:MAG TPA: hypothetical protein VKS21_10450 [Spirochaetota bacterium]|nr:hypothetical protein [Spirochaetota bacterium]